MLSIPQGKKNQTNKEETDKMKIGGKDIEFVTVVLVGLCNSESLSQIFIGMAVFRECNGQPELRLIDYVSGRDIGSAKNPLKPTFQCKKKGSYCFCFPELGGGYGVSIDLNRKDGKYYFTTGINHGDSGSSGLLSSGGPELADVLDVLFGFVPAS